MNALHKNDVWLRLATVDDAAALAAIYSPYVLETAISFETEAPDEAEFARRIADTLKSYPYIVAEVGGAVVGYCYAAHFKTRAAYDWAVETTVYLADGWQGKGIGRRLYAALEELLLRQNITNLNACVALDNEGSRDFHLALGYRQVAHFHQCGYKLGKWYDMIWLEKLAGEHLERPAAVVPFVDICDEARAYLAGL